MADLERPVEQLDDVTEAILAEKHGHATMQDYLGFLGKVYQRHYWHSAVIELSKNLEPIDSLGQRDAALPTSQAFMRGTLLGAHVVRHAQGTEFLAGLGVLIHEADFEAACEGSRDKRSWQVQFAEGVLQKGHSGLESTDPNIFLIEQLEDQIVDDPMYQRFGRDGFGFMLDMAHELMGQYTALEERKTIDAIADECIKEFDWDNAHTQLGLA